MIVLGIESSCDETAVGIVDSTRHIRANLVASQIDTHRAYGGVVPEIAARAHLDHIDGLVKGALQESGLDFGDLDGVAATCGPGLIGGVMVGAMVGKAIAAVRAIPFLAINHLEAHALTARLTDDVAFPYLLLLVSGGHCQILLVEGVGRYRQLGSTIDDAVGECFDKAAKLMDLGYPGGPAVERAALQGDSKAIDLPRPMLGRKGCDFSFSGLKTAVRLAMERAPEGEDRAIYVADLAASLQRVIGEVLADRVDHAFEALGKCPVTALVAAGGVAANQALRTHLTKAAAHHGVPYIAPPPKLCTDNGAMIAWAGLERLRLGLSDSLDVKARPRWPLDPAVG